MKKEYMFFYIESKVEDDLEYIGCMFVTHDHRIDLQRIVDMQDEDEYPKLFMSTEPPGKEYSEYD